MYNITECERPSLAAQQLIAQIGGSKRGPGCVKGVIIGANYARSRCSQHMRRHRRRRRLLMPWEPGAVGVGGGRSTTPRRALSAGLVLVRLRPVLDMQ